MGTNVISKTLGEMKKTGLDGVKLKKLRPNDDAPPGSSCVDAETSWPKLMPHKSKDNHLGKLLAKDWGEQKVMSATKTADYLIFTDGSSLEDLRIGSGMVMHDKDLNLPHKASMPGKEPG